MCNPKPAPRSFRCACFQEKTNQDVGSHSLGPGRLTVACRSYSFGFPLPYCWNLRCRRKPELLHHAELIHETPVLPDLTVDKTPDYALLFSIICVKRREKIMNFVPRQVFLETVHEFV